MTPLNKICFVIVYLGEFPTWFAAFLYSCRFNPSIDWLIFTDSNSLPFHKPDNVHFRKITLLEFRSIAEKKTGTKVQFTNPHKLCDFKPMYGHIFQSDLESYEYWGHCDLDLIWGDVVSFLSSIDYQEYDIISTRKFTICGHFTLYRNIPSINTFFRQVSGFEKLLVQDSYSGFDEGFFSFQLYQESLKSDTEFKFFWPKKHSVDWPELLTKPHGWYWLNGKIYGRKNRERVYIHFMKWKDSVQYMDFDFSDNPKKFLITQHGIWSKPMKLQNKLKYYFSDHYGRLISRYYDKLIDKIFKRKRQEGPLIPEGYKIIE